MVGFGLIRGAASAALAMAFVAAPLAQANGQPAPSRDRAVRTRTLAWPGGDRLFVAVNADVRYVQGPGAKVVITGPADEIDDIVVDRGAIRHEGQRWGWALWNWTWRWNRAQDIRIVVTAPHVEAAGVSGSGHLDLGRLAQDRLGLSVSGSGGLDVSGQFKTLEVSVSGSGAARLGKLQVGAMDASLSGSGWIRASGTAGSLHLSVSGSGADDMSGLIVQDAAAHLSGSGSAKLSPRRSADIGVSGSGSVHLLSRPPRLTTHRSGSGAILLPDGSRG